MDNPTDRAETREVIERGHEEQRENDGNAES
jgi:hypothetical protein